MFDDIVYKRLKNIIDLPGNWFEDIDEYDSSKEYSDDTNLHINSEMVERFGDGRKYEFHRINGYMSSGGYTHKSDDGYYYHESWFIDEPEVELEPELFEI